jgi:hypothetical protein
MAQHLTSTTPATLVADGVRVTNNLALTGTITVSVAGSTQYGTPAATIAVITNPVVGEVHAYHGLRTQGTISVTPSTTCDISVDAIGPGQS